MRRVLAAVALVLGTAAAPARAYEPATHAEISAWAARQSRADEVLGVLGAGSLNAPAYDGRTLLDWLRLGAMEEDNVPRFLNHFYNPLTGRGLSVLGKDGVPSPDWGLDEPRPRDEQTFSFADAVEYYHRGLTLPTKAERDTQLALTFRTLGQVIHLVQDAAQPQHTRDEAHFPFSEYERFTDTLRDTLPYLGYAPVALDVARDYWHTEPAPIRPPTDVLRGRGMAEYSNRGFVTQGTNYRLVPGTSPPDAVTAPGFPLPAFDREAVTTLDVTELEALFPDCRPGAPLSGRVTFYGNEVPDAYDPAASAFNAFGSSVSTFFFDLQQLVPSVPLPVFTHNRFTYCAAHGFLIPRAVGYSAGLMDYFFRGKLEGTILQTDGVLGVYVFNASGAGRTFRDGVFEVYYDATDGTRKPLPITSGATVGRAGLEWLGNVALTTPVPADVDERRPRPYTVVFRGTIGGDPGVAAVTLGDSTTRQVQAWYGRATYEINGNVQDPLEGHIFGSGATWYDEEGRRYTIGVGPYYALSPALPPGTPAEYNYWRDVSYFYMVAEIVQYETGTVLFQEIRPYANSGTLTLSGGQFTVTYTYTAERDDTARVCLVNQTYLEYCLP
jgi:hypothetical protein